MSGAWTFLKVQRKRPALNIPYYRNHMDERLHSAKRIP